MAEVKLDLDESGHGGFRIYEDGKEVGVMVVSVAGGKLTAYHTEVNVEGKGYAKELLNAMVDYAKSHQLKVIPLCPFVSAQFRRHPELYKSLL